MRQIVRNLGEPIIGAGAAARRPAGMLEDDVRAVLWTGSRLMSPAEVWLDLEDRLAYTTVMSTLTRLYDKQLVRPESTGRGLGPRRWMRLPAPPRR
jgi:hypothetical protein